MQITPLLRSSQEVNKRIFSVLPSAAIAMKGLFMLELVLIKSETSNSENFYKKSQAMINVLMATNFHLRYQAKIVENINLILS